MPYIAIVNVWKTSFVTGFAKFDLILFIATLKCYPTIWLYAARSAFTDGFLPALLGHGDHGGAWGHQEC